MTAYWPTEDGWPYADVEGEEIDLAADADDDLLSLRVELYGTAAHPSHLLSELDILEREVISRRFGLQGRGAATMKEIQADLGVPRSELRGALGTGLAKLRTHLT